MHYQDREMDRPSLISSRNDHYAAPASFQMKRMIKHGLIGGAVLAVNVIVITVIFMNQNFSDAFFHLFPGSYFFGLLAEGSIVGSMILAALCAPVYFCIGYFTWRYAGLACLIALVCFLLVDACSYLVVFFITGDTVTSFTFTLLIYVFPFLADVFFALIIGFGFTGLGALLRQNQKRDALPKS